MNSSDEKSQPVDIGYWAEFCCWTTVLLAPFLTWVNGPSVSTDQFVVRTAVFSLALTGAVVFRATKLVRRWRNRSR